MFGAIGSIAGNLFGTPRAAEKALDYVAAGVDALWHTDEEKAHEAQAAKERAFDKFLGWLEATKGSRLARRIIALIVVGMWATTLGAAIVLAVAALWVEPVLIKTVVDGAVVEVMMNRPQAASELLFEQAVEQKDFVIWVLAFYFGGPVVMDAGKAVVGKYFGNKGGEQSANK